MHFFLFLVDAHSHRGKVIFSFLFFKVLGLLYVVVVSSSNKNLCCQSLILPPHLGLGTRIINLYIPSFRNNVGLLILSVEYRGRARKPCRKNLFPFHCLLVKYKELGVGGLSKTFLSSF